MASKFESLTADKRDQLGSRANKRLRDQGLVPAVVYGHNEAVLPVSINRKIVAKHLDRSCHEHHSARLHLFSGISGCTLCYAAICLGRRTRQQTRSTASDVFRQDRNDQA